MTLILFLLLSFAPAQQTDLCIIGSPLQNQYVAQFNKPVLTEDETFLRKFREFQAKQSLIETVGDALEANPFRGLTPKFRLPSVKNKQHISKNLIECSLRRVPIISTTKKICENTDSDLLEPKNLEFYTEETPCVTQSMVDYIHWGFNEALRCFSNDLDEVGRLIIYKKINLESSFGFFFQSINGTGVAQVIPKDIQEMLKEGYLGHKFLKTHIEKNPTKCDSFSDLFKKDILINSDQKIPQCQFISMGDGIGRSYLAGVALYIYYRSYHPASAEKILSYLGIPKSNSVQYRNMRSLLALGMYNKGPGTVWDSVKFHFQENELLRKYKKSPQHAYNKLRQKISNTSFYVYITELENIYDKTVDRKGRCLLPQPQQQVVKNQYK